MAEMEKELKTSFEERYGQQVKQIQPIKQDYIYCINTIHDRYILKCFRDQSQLRWQVKCLTQLVEKDTRGIVPYIANQFHNHDNPFSQGWYAVLPFIPGKAVDPRNVKQIMHCFRLLAYFHERGKGIYGKPQVIPFRSIVLQKWHKRLELFQDSLEQTEEAWSEQTGVISLIRELGDEAIHWAQIALENIPEAYMLYLEEQAQWERQIAHLDVVPHNFLFMESNFYYLIDYDLMDYAPPFLDIIQFLNRTLSFHDWSYEFAMTAIAEYRAYHPVQAHQDHLFPLFLLYPQDIFREWLGVYRRVAGYHPQKALHYFEQLSRDWGKRKVFVQQCLAMLK